MKPRSLKTILKKKFFMVSGLAFLIISIALLWLTSVVMYQRGLDRLSEEGTIKLDLFVTYLQGVLKTYETLPELLAINHSLVNALLNPGEDKRIDTLNRYLATINSISDTADTYLMDAEGLTIAASNWQTEHPFVGRNFSFRPYFQEAMKGQLGRYFALGTTSSRRGYYFAYPVRKDGRILGVVVIKINIDQVEKAWGHKKDIFLVTDPDGVVFITTNAQWRFHTLRLLAPEVRKRIIESRRYPNTELARLSKVERTLGPGRQLAQLYKNAGDSGNHDYLLLTRSMPEAGWNIHVLADIGEVRRNVLWDCIMVGSILVMSYMLLLLLVQRRFRMTELERIRQESRRALEEANEKLENRVQERTGELTETNKLLRREIQDRQRTEAALKKTRNELIHAAKMAVLGQMSAGINHELNQPLAAIRSYTDNGRQFLEKGRLEEAKWNLEQIGELTERMAKIGVQLKLFSRKAGSQIDIVPLHGVIDGALEILRHSIRKVAVQVQVRLTPEDMEVKANNVLLQQVLVNLIGNAVQAVEEHGEGKVCIEAEIDGARARIRVRDNGPGIREADIPHIFDPFFTTKKSGQGLGLGLTISDRILREMNGKIRLAANSERGACFEIALDKA